MNWKWLIPVFGIGYLIDDDLANSNNDYMRWRLPIGLCIHLFGIFMVITLVADHILAVI